MAFKSIITVTCVCLTVASFSVSAAIISVDWQAGGDNLITRDTISKLDWLDLTETSQMTYSTVFAALAEGGQFDGWRYATSEEVITLWDQFGVDLSNPSSWYSSTVDSGITMATGLLGDILAPGRDIGVYGIAGSPSSAGFMDNMGAWYIQDEPGLYQNLSFVSQIEPTFEGYYGSYLVKTSVVPVPAAVWLFGSGLLGLVGVARRKKA